MKRPAITHERLLEVLDYSIVSGRFYWRVSPANNAPVGSRAGAASTGGYIQIKFKKVACGANRVAWFYVTGEWPKHEVDHVNGARGCNGWHNLRDVTKVVNGQNRRTPKVGNTVGLLGVSPRHGRFVASVYTGGRGGTNHYLGTYDTPEEAHAVYVDAKRQLHEGCTL